MAPLPSSNEPKPSIQTSGPRPPEDGYTQSRLLYPEEEPSWVTTHETWGGLAAARRTGRPSQSTIVLSLLGPAKRGLIKWKLKPSQFTWGGGRGQPSFHQILLSARCSSLITGYLLLLVFIFFLCPYQSRNLIKVTALLNKIGIPLAH